MNKLGLWHFTLLCFLFPRNNINFLQEFSILGENSFIQFILDYFLVVQLYYNRKTNPKFMH